MIKRLASSFLKFAVSDFRKKQSCLNFFYREYERDVFRRLVDAGFRSVLAGPFKGLEIQETESSKNFRTVHLLGLFETCLRSKVLYLAEKNRHVVNIGCGTGYYTNGLAFFFRNKGVPVSIEGYDIDPNQIRAAKSLQKHNGLTTAEHIRVEAGHDYSGLAGRKAFCLIDIEGGEYPLLESQKDAFVQADMLIEIHKTGERSLEEGIAFLKSLFSDTHDGSVIEEEKTIDLSLLNTISGPLDNIAYMGLHVLACENRSYPMKWLVLERKQ